MINVIEKELIFRELARRQYLFFLRYINENFIETKFGLEIINLLELFAKDKIRKLIITLPPQHGKSFLSTVNFIPYLLLNKKNLKIAVVGYNFHLVRKFSDEIRRICISDEYKALSNIGKEALLSMTKENIFFSDTNNSVIFVGRGGGLTGNKVDILIIDDLYKDYMEANSEVIREGIKDWFFSVAQTRLHNNSKQLIVMTRWHHEDIVGVLFKKERYEFLTKKEQLENIKKDIWYILNLPAVSTAESIKNEFDYRKQPNIALWEELHSLEKLLNFKSIDPEKFEILYQGNPQPASGFLFKQFNVYSIFEENNIIAKMAYIDVAEGGGDRLFI